MTPPHQTAPIVLGCTSSTMATRFAATRVPLAARRSGELRPCKLAPARLRSRAIHCLGHRPTSPMRKLSADANRQTVPISPVRKASESDARHSQLVAPIDARVGGLHPRDERSRHLDLSRPHFPLGQPGLRFLAKGLRPRLRTSHMEQSGQPRSEGFENVRGGLVPS